LYNCLLLTGDSEKVAAAFLMFREMAEDQIPNEPIYLPEFVATQNNCIWNIAFDGQRICFQTRLLLNLDALQQIADHFRLGFINQYQNYIDISMGKH
jgi:hypothetical protein